eukprot:m.405300 g.405300  ORF g.405300 m.405300 type:complete len:138 (+) comp21205_c0_seq10:1271-1684(+)
MVLLLLLLLLLCCCCIVVRRRKTAKESTEDPNLMILAPTHQPIAPPRRAKQVVENPMYEIPVSQVEVEVDNDAALYEVAVSGSQLEDEYTTPVLIQTDVEEPEICDGFPQSNEAPSMSCYFAVELGVHDYRFALALK